MIQLKVAKIGDVLTETSHAESWKRIQEIEAPREKTPGYKKLFIKLILLYCFY